LAADVPAEQELDAASMETARRIVQNRVDALGLAEPVVQAQGERRIIVELPGVQDPEQAVDTIRSTALLEFVHAGFDPLMPGTLVTTTLGPPEFGASSPGLPESGEAPPEEEETDDDLSGLVASTVDLTQTDTMAASPLAAGRVYSTVLTGSDLENVGLDVTERRDYYVPFTLTPEGAEKFAAYTGANVGKHLCIVLDKVVVSCPIVQQQIPNGSASISGDFDFDTARQLTVQLRYGRLPVPLSVESFNRVGATLGTESVQKSVRAGIIGLVIVLLFMLVYYRLPGALADVALVIYVLLNIALYKLIPVTLTLPGIAGFILSAGMAVDANILIFERMKEELRSGRSLSAAIETGFNRAWPSIRDAQISTLIICAILFIFGTNFGASVVKGFALTLAVGTVVNVFTAVFATRTFVRVLADAKGEEIAERSWLMGV
jgi:protein-export membrane protein SecD